jgi:hypothetical protein
MAIYIPFALGFNLPPYWLNRRVTILGHDDTDGADAGVSVVKEIQDEYIKDDEDVIKGRYLGNLYQAPLSIKLESESEWWKLPFDPVMSVTGKNIIIRRNVLKIDGSNNRRGSIKEIWSQDDYEVNIAGVLIGEDGKRPEADLMKLRTYFEAREPILVSNELFRIFNIERLAIENYALPSTKGIENQTFTIKAYSNDMFELLIKDE